MIKGVNRRVVEVHNPQSMYFEKAVFYLKPNLEAIPQQLLTEDARQCFRTYSTPLYRPRVRIRRLIGSLLLLAIACGGGCLLGYLLFHG